VSTSETWKSDFPATYTHLRKSLGIKIHTNTLQVEVHYEKKRYWDFLSTVCFFVCVSEADKFWTKLTSFHEAL
jgi:hypothetical protein